VERGGEAEQEEPEGEGTHADRLGGAPGGVKRRG
jgi:hypothetical protein